MASITSPGIGSGLDVATLVEQLVIAEGAATAFRLDTQEAEALTELSAFGSLSGAEDLPPVPGYEFGRYIVNSYLENAPDVPIPEWSLLSAEEIFVISGYAGSRTSAK